MFELSPRAKRNLAFIMIAALLIISAVGSLMWFFHTYPGFTPASTYESAYANQVVCSKDSREAQALSDLIQACSFAYSTAYGGEVTDAFITVGCGYDAWANFYALVVQPDGDMYSVSIPFDYYDAELVYEAFDGRYNQEQPDYYMKLSSELALNRMLDVSIHICDQHMAITPPHFTSVQAEEELAEKLESGEVVRLEAPAVENLNTLLDMQEIHYLQVQEAFVTSYYWQYLNWFNDRSYEFQPTILWIRSTSGLLYTFELPSESNQNVSYPNQFVDDLNDPDCWFIFVFDNDGTISQLCGPMAPGALHP